MTRSSASPGTGRKLTLVVLGLAALITAMLCAFALPSLHSGPHQVPVGATGPARVTEALQESLDGPNWDVRLYEASADIESAVKSGDLAGGLAVTARGIEVYTATAGGPSATSALTALGERVAAQHDASVTVRDLVPFTEDDPRGAGLTAALMPMIFGGIFPALILSSVFPGHRGLRIRLAGALMFSAVAGTAVAAVLQFGTHSVDGTFGLTALGVILGMAAMSTLLLGLQARLGVAGFAFGGALMMLLGNPLSGLATGPHWLPDGWATVGQLLPPGASGSLLRANGFFDGSGGGSAVLVLMVWVVLGIGLALIADRGGRRTTGSRSTVVARSETADTEHAELGAA
ncbi:hypothetical protein [Streptomyces sp. NPDC005385]|uniref:hypothetical protein n=1 Tax=Streptomyces sp. NPDC005385 TaxID=3157039 RepID=UPI0033A95CF6